MRYLYDFISFRMPGRHWRDPIRMLKAISIILLLMAANVEIALATPGTPPACPAPSIPTTVTQGGLDRLFTYKNVNLNGTGSNVINVSPGQSVNVQFDFTSQAQSGTICPSCVTQGYWGIYQHFNFCTVSFTGYNASTHVNQTVTAPTQPGIYYITDTRSWQFSCLPNNFQQGCNPGTNPFAALIVGTPQNTIAVSISGNNFICPGGSTLLTGNITGFGCNGPANRFQWRLNGTDIAGATSPSYTATQAGDYLLLASDCYGNGSLGQMFVTMGSLPSASASSSSPDCAGTTLSLFGSGGDSYFWSGPNGFSSNQQNPVIPNVPVAASGTYTLTAFNSCGSNVTSTNVTIFPLPSAAASNNGPVATGGTLTLSASGGTGYSWTGPNGFTSTLQNPSITNAQTNASGTYTVTVTANGCTSVASTSATVAPPAGALNFDGINDFVQSLNNVGISGNSNRTIEARINISSFETDGTGILYWGGTGNNQLSLFAVSSTGKLGYAAFNHDFYGNTSLNLNQWYHVAMVFDGSTVNFYINGVLDASIASGTFATLDGQLNLGRYTLSTGWGDGFKPMSMDEVRIWNRALCQGEIQNSMNCELTGSQTGLRTYYKFNHGLVGANNAAFTTLSDFSGNLNNGSLNNFALNGNSSNWITGNVSGNCSAFVPPTASITAGGPTTFCSGNSVLLTASAGSAYLWSNGATTQSISATTTGSYSVTVTNASGCKATAAAVSVTALALPNPNIAAAGPTTFCNGGSVQLTASSANSAGTALQFNGNNYAYINRNIQNDFTIEAWIKTTDPFNSGGSQFFEGAGLMYADVGGINNDFGTSILNGKFAFGTGNPDITITSTTTVSTGQWFHVAAVRKQSTGLIQIYVNGVLEAQTNTGTQALNAPGQIIMGANVIDSRYYTGTLDEMRLWTTARSVAEIQSNMNSTVPTNTSGLVGYWRYNEGTGNQAVDISPSNNTGTLVNNPTWVSSSAPIQSSYTWSPAAGLNISLGAIVTASPATTTSYIVTATNASGCSNTATQLVTVNPNPSVTATSTAVTCAGGTNGTITASGSGGTAPYQYKLNAGAFQSSATYTGVSTGSHTITIMDSKGCTGVTPVTVIQQDLVAPVAVCKNLSVTLDATGNATIIAAQLNNGSTDNCGISSMTLSKSTFNCTNVGANTVILTVTDAGGNSATCSSTVTVSDNIAPVITCPANMNVTSQSNLRANYPLLNGLQDATGNNGNFILSSNAGTPPAAPSGGNPLCINGNYTQGPGGQDALSPVIAGFTPNNYHYNVEFMVHGYPKASNVGLQPDGYPVIATNRGFRGQSLYISKTGEVGIKYGSSQFAWSTTIVTPGQWYSASVSYAGNIAKVTLDGTEILSFNSGANTFFTDLRFGTTDFQAGRALYGCVKNLQIYSGQVVCNPTVAYAAPTVTDNCAGSTVVQTSGLASGSVFPVGVTTNSFKATDASGNTANCSFTVTVVDNILPTVKTKPVTIQLNSSGNVSITAAQVDNGSFDNCAVASLSVSPSSFTCANVGTNTVTLSVTDVNGNTNTGTATVTVQDLVAPSVITQNISVNLDATGNATITAAQVNNGSSDACGIAGMSVSPNAFTCSNVGPNTVTLTVTDVNGNTAFATATVNVNDVTVPTVITQPVTVQLNAGGTGSVTAAQVNNGSNDACGIASMSVTPSTFSCTNVGNNTVTLTVTDVNGNVNTGSAIVTVEDNVAPVAICNNLTLQLNASGQASIQGSPVTFYNQSCDRTTLTFSNTTQSFTATQSGFITSIGAGIGLNGTGTAYGTSISTPSAGTVNYGTLGYSGRCCYNPCAPGNNMAFTTLPTPFYVNAGEVVTISFTGSGGERHFSGGILRMYITGNDPTSLVDGGSSDACGIASKSISKASFNCSNVGTNPVTLTVKDVNGNVSTCISTVTVQDNVAPVAIAKNITVQLDVTGNVSITAAQVNNGSSDACGIASLTVSPGSFTCANVGNNNVVLTVTDVNGNVSTAGAVVTVQDNVAPVAIAQSITIQLNAAGNASITAAQVNNGSSDACGIASMTVSPNSFNCSKVGNNNVTLTVTDNNGNVSTAAAVVTVQDNVAPVVVTQNLTVNLNASGAASITAAQVNNGSSDACGIASMVVSPSGFDCSNTGINVVTLTVTDVNGNISSANANVDVKDVTKPVLAGCPSNVTLNSISNNCMQNHLWAEPTATDNCAGTTIAVTTSNPTVLILDVGPVAFAGFPVGTTTVTYTATDASGNVSSCSFDVKVLDVQPPTITGCPSNISMNNAPGQCDRQIFWNAPTASDNCSGVTFSTSHIPGSTFPVGSTNVTYTATDASGNISTCVFSVTVTDNEKPITVCQNISVNLDATGNASITAAQVNNGSTDNCGIASMSVSPSAFTCANTGANTVTLTVTDIHGNSSFCTATVAVSDVTAPVASCQNLSVFLDATGNASITAAQVDNGSTDACGVSLSISQSAFTCAHVGSNSVTLTVTDPSGNSSFCNATVTVVDNIAPVATAQNISVQLDAGGNASITAAQVNDGSSDACGIASMSVSPNSFNCSNVGANNVTLTVTDNNGNSSNIGAVVTVSDDVAPVVVTQDITIQLDASGNASITAAQVDNGSSDACGIASVTVSQTAFDCSHVGANVVTLTVTDVNGNISAANATVTVEDNVAPVASAQSITVQLDAGGNVSITASQVDNGSSDACGIASMSVSPNSFSCSHVGNNSVTLTVTDVNGNISTAGATVTVEDNVAPVASAQDITVQLDASGNVSIIASQVDNGSADACGIQSMTVAPNTFNCSNAGPNNVTLVVTDNNGNSSTASAVVTVEDNVAPVAISRNITIQLDAAGNAAITASQVDNGSSDACGIASTSVSQTAFDCSHVGANAVILTVTDVNGNISTAGATVTVEDNVAPVASAQSITVQLDASGNVSITAAQVDNGSSDACGIASLSVSPNSFNCSNVGNNAVTLTVTDVNGNVSTTGAIVTVEDNVAPVANTQDITVQLDASGNAGITAAQVDNGSNDACGIASLSVSPSAFDCSNVGANTVTLTVTDVNGNVSVSDAVVTVEDNVAPVPATQNITIQLNAMGSAMITAAMVDNGSSDACGIASLGVAPFAFNCSNVGNNTVVLTVTDVNGNVSTANATVTVQDNVAPVATAQDITVQLDANGNVSITPSQVNNGSSDACGIASMSVSPNSFSCANIGDNNVTLTVTDVNGNVSTAGAVVTVEDNVAPVALCRNLNITLVNGVASITPAQVNNGSNDACGIQSVTLSKTVFNCANIGNNNVTLSVVDNNGNTSSCQSTVTVTGTLPTCQITLTPGNNTYTGGDPSVIYLGYGPQTVTLNATGGSGAPFTYAWNGSDLSTTTGASTVFSPTTAGNYQFVCTVTNTNGCKSTCTITICVIDIRVSGSSKVKLCHVPSGNPGNAHTLQISTSAVSAHLGNHSGDKLGSCGTDCNFAKTEPEVSGELLIDEVSGIDLVVFPNPSASNFSFKLESSSEEVMTVKVYDMSGKMVAEVSGKEKQLSVGENLSQGMYTAIVTQGSFFKVVKITKVN
jgi:hypothetical protein